MGAQLGREADPDVHARCEGEHTLTVKLECKKESDMHGKAMRAARALQRGHAALDKALQLEPSDASALRARGVAKRMLCRFEESIADLDKALQLRPSDAIALKARGDAKKRLGRLRRRPLLTWTKPCSWSRAIPLPLKARGEGQADAGPLRRGYC